MPSVHINKLKTWLFDIQDELY